MEETEIETERKRERETGRETYRLGVRNSENRECPFVNLVQLSREKESICGSYRASYTENENRDRKKKSPKLREPNTGLLLGKRAFYLYAATTDINSSQQSAKSDFYLSRTLMSQCFIVYCRYKSL